MKNRSYQIRESENYIVYDTGIVWSNRKNKYIKPHKIGNGYIQIDINGKPMYLHRLIATLFIPNPENKPQVNHIDGNPQNNDVSNLEWCTQSENNIHANRTGLRKKKRRKLTDNDVVWVKQLNVTGYPQRLIGIIFGVSHPTIGKILRGETYVNYN